MKFNNQSFTGAGEPTHTNTQIERNEYNIMMQSFIFIVKICCLLYSDVWFVFSICDLVPMGKKFKRNGCISTRSLDRLYLFHFYTNWPENSRISIITTQDSRNHEETSMCEWIVLGEWRLGQCSAEPLDVCVCRTSSSKDKRISCWILKHVHSSCWCV
jgi:hypothetical protein